MVPSVADIHLTQEISDKMVKDIRISIIIPVYNAEDTLERCIGSITSQDLREIEIICVDDCSTDSSYDILMRLQKEDDRIVVLKNEKNLGTMMSRRRGVFRAEGEYIMFADNDDIYLPEKFSRIYSIAVDEGADIIQYGAEGRRSEDNEWISDERIIRYNRELKFKEERYKGKTCLLTEHTPDRLWNKIFRADVCRKGYECTEDLFLTHAEDTYACWFIFFHARSFVSVEDVLYVHYLGEGLTSRKMTPDNYDSWVGCRKRCADSIRRYLASSCADEDIMVRFRREENKWFMYCARTLKRKDIGDAFDEYAAILEKYYGAERVNDAILRKGYRTKRSCEDGKPSRLMLYLFYDKHGIVGDHVIYQLKQMKKVTGHIVIICQGEVLGTELSKFAPITGDVMIRKNTGYDAGGWRDCLQNHLGRDLVMQYDELLLMNDSCYGPVFPIEEMFEVMDGRECDFWGVTKNYRTRDPYGICPYGYFPDHIQSYFILFRKTLFGTSDFWDLWNGLTDTDSFEKAVSNFEVVLTKHFEDLGYRSDSYIDTSEHRAEDLKNLNPTLYDMYEILTEKRDPFVKRRHLQGEFLKHVKISDGSMAVKCMEYIREHSDMDIDLIYSNLIRTGNPRDLYETLNLNHFLQENSSAQTGKRRRVALLIHLYYEELLEYCFDYIRNMPEYSDVYITTSRKDLMPRIREMSSSVRCRKLEIREVDNKGQDISALLVGGRDIFLMDYDYICFIHDKMAASNDPIRRAKDGFRDNMFECMLGTRDYIENILAVFDNSPYEGLLVPSFPMSGTYGFNHGLAWFNNEAGVKKLARMLGLRCDVDREKEMIATGSTFWCRPEALRKLMTYNWTYDDFPDNSLRCEGDILHSVERLFEFVAQDAGYLTGIVMPVSRAELVFSVQDKLFIERNRGFRKQRLKLKDLEKKKK